MCSSNGITEKTCRLSLGITMDCVTGFTFLLHKQFAKKDKQRIDSIFRLQMCTVRFLLSMYFMGACYFDTNFN